MRSSAFLKSKNIYQPMAFRCENNMKNVPEKIDWEKGGGLVPDVIQDADTRAILMLAYMNKESLAKTLETGKAWFYSRSKKRLWMKGEESGNVLNVVEVKMDCDNDAILIKAKPAGPTCHTGDYSCFHEEKGGDDFSKLFATILARKGDMPQGSYTASLFKAGTNQIVAKVCEEALEVGQAAKKETKQRVIEEATDLIYHLFVLLAEKGISLSDIKEEMRKRKK